jgi:hypothetical protein
VLSTRKLRCWHHEWRVPGLLRMLWRVGSNLRARLVENMSVMNLFSAVISLHIELPKPPRDYLGAATMFSVLKHVVLPSANPIYGRSSYS